MLRSRNAALRRQAQERLIEQGADGIHSLVGILEQEAKRRKSKQVVSRTIRFSLYTLVLLFLLLAHGPPAIPIVFQMCLGIMMFLGETWAGASRAQMSAAQALASIADKRLIGVLIDMLAYERKAAVEALIRVLPTLQASDASQLNAHRRNALYFGLDMQFMDEAKLTEDHATYVVAILKALEQVGDEKALARVEKLTELRAFSPAQKQVVQAAKDCRPFLQQRAEQAKIGGTLLRASCVEEQPADHLLRPLEARLSEPPNELLRAGTPNASSERDTIA